ncbi:unnamed protein product [Timema podura]|uniref:PH domain-containing protein n=1 Tax=Timema podura TaxID=61482 RepID=A0ABN7NRE5_TIMPD|nr:unnamed protein product [Timema podura]
MFKLRASDARARHEWVSRIRAITEMHTMAIAHSNPPLSPRKHHSISVSPAAPSVSSHCSLALLDAFTTVQDHLHQAEASYFQVCRIAEELQSFGIYKSQNVVQSIAVRLYSLILAVIMGHWSNEHPMFAVETFFKCRDIVVFLRHLNISRTGQVKTRKAITR